MNTIDLERSKYERMWAVKDYAETSPGERFVDAFMEEADPKVNATLLDLGCGCGRVSLVLAEQGFKVTRLDITDAGLTDEKLPFIQQSLWQPIPGMWDYGYCCDVMEHIPIEYVMATLQRIAEACHEAWFSIAFIDDAMGKHIGERLHMTVMPFLWWKQKLGEIGEVLDARDMLAQGTFFVRF